MSAFSSSTFLLVVFLVSESLVSVSLASDFLVAGASFLVFSACVLSVFVSLTLVSAVSLFVAVSC